MWEGLSEYIQDVSGEKGSSFKVIEVAVGKFFDVSDYLSKCSNIELIKTDINPANEGVLKDDVSNPDLSIYENVDLIYSIRPPYEIQPYLIDLQEVTGAILIIKPLTGEDMNVKGKKMRLKTYKKTSFFVYP
jgi:uncharacterized UPF0146 family protein